MNHPILDQARRTLQIESAAIHALIERLDEHFVAAVELLFQIQGRVVVTGIGKSGIIARKISATLASTGTPAFFLHPAEGSHGDIGMVTVRDVVIALSNSGETAEVIALLPPIKRLGIPLISLLGRPRSTLARLSDIVLDVSVKEEACPLGLAPTSSTMAAMAMGDALAVALLDKRGFDAKQFAQLHPGGNLGRKLLLRVQDVMHTGPDIPQVKPEDPLRTALLEITSKRLGLTGVLDDQQHLLGILTDGDVRRFVEQQGAALDCPVAQVMTRNPKTIHAEALAVEALRIMQTKKITSLFVLSQDKTLIGVIHLHDLLDAGLM